MQPAPSSTTNTQGLLPRHYYLISILLPIVLCITLISATELSLQQQQMREQSLRQGLLTDRANELRTNFEYDLNSILSLTTGIVAYIQSKQGVLVAQEVEPWLTNLHDRAQNIRNIGIAPNNTITFIYPLAGNEAALGLYYPNNAQQWPAVEKLIAKKEPLLAGPINLAQGGRGLIYRIPVFLTEGQYWGLVSTVLDFDAIYDSLNSRAKALELSFSVLDVDNNNQHLFGDEYLAETTSWALTIPGRNWRIAISLKDAPHTTFLPYLRLVGWLVGLLLALFLHIFLRSIAKQHKTLVELNASKFRFSQAFNNAPQGIALINQRGAFINLNEALCSMLHFTQAELIDKNIFDIVAFECKDKLRQIIVKNETKPVASQQQSIFIDKSGKKIDVIISLAPTDTDPEISDWIVQLVDISQRIVVERLLEEEAQYNQRILNAVLDGIITLDSKGIICSANPAACKIFGISADKLIDQCIDTIVQKADSGNIIQHYLSQSELPAVTDIAAGLNSNINTEIVAFTGNGLAIPIDFQLSSINRKQEKIFIAVIRDLSEQKRLEQLKNDFISTTSHELRTPLTSILGSLKLLECGSLGDMTEPVKKLIKIANQNGQKLTLLINDLLDMDKLLSGQMQFDLQVQPLKPLVILALENIGVYAQQYQVGLTLENAATEFLVNVDGQRLQQVLTNLLSNAAKFSPQGGQVTVNIKPVNNRVRIEVIDCGMGISAEGQKKLFTKFYQVDSSSTRKAGGTGLGLAISKELIEAMQGTIGVSSELGKGSCFYVDLPIAS